MSKIALQQAQHRASSPTRKALPDTAFLKYNLVIGMKDNEMLVKLDFLLILCNKTDEYEILNGRMR